METTAFEMSGVRIQYGVRCAVEDLSLSLKQGGALGLLGLNGAGKTSTIRALMGMLRPSRGTVTVFGGTPGNPKIFRKIGFAPETAFPPEYLTAREYLSFVASFRLGDRIARKREVAESLEFFELSPAKKIREYSKGMVKRLILAQAFLGSPEMLVLDEPLNGLDPLVIIKLRQKLDQYRGRGGAVLYSSHILAEVEKTCTDIAILSQGKLVCRAPLAEVLSEHGSVENAFAAKVGAGQP